jgi:hypothetical protein
LGRDGEIPQDKSDAASSLQAEKDKLEAVFGRGLGGTKFGALPSGYVKIAIENGHRNSGFSH